MLNYVQTSLFFRTVDKRIKILLITNCMYFASIVIVANNADYLQTCMFCKT